MQVKQDLRQLLESNDIDPDYFDLDSFQSDQQSFYQALQRIRGKYSDLASEPVWSVHQVLKGRAT